MPFCALKRRAAGEGWRALRDARARAAREKPREATEAGTAPAGGPKSGGAGESDAEIAQRVRRKMLMKLEQMAEAIPPDAVTERKGQDDSTTTMFKLRDLTAAFKELTGDLPAGDEERETVRVILDP